jgi:tetratricopeptide (TPR) repeat protein
MTDNNSHKYIFGRNRCDVLICLFLVFSTLAVYWQVTNHEFINYDDDFYITENYHVQAGLKISGLIWSFTSGTMVSNYWHPLTWLSHMLDFQLYGMNAGGHHMTSLLFHITNTLLLFFIFRRMTGNVWKSGCVAALFALHPLHVESVAWVAERKDVLSTFFWLLTMLAYSCYVEKPVLIRYFIVLLFFVLGLMSKPMLVTLPFVLLLMDYWPLGRIQLGQVIKPENVIAQKASVFHLVGEKIPLFLLSAVASVAAYITQQKGDALARMDLALLKIQTANALVSYVSYIRKMIWPSQLAVFYPHPGTLPIWKSVGAGLLLISLTVFFIVSWRRFPYLSVGWFWFIGTLIPVIGLVKVGSFAMADRYTYIPLIGLFIIIAWLVPELVERRPHKKILLVVLATICLLTLTTLTWKQLRYWKNSTVLFDHTLNVTSENYLAHTKLGEVLLEHDKIAEAIRHYLEAVRIEPYFVQAHLNLGDAYAGLGNNEDAIYYYNEALKKKPNYAKAQNNLGNVMARKGNFKTAVYHYNEALKINPNYAGAYYNLGKIDANQGKIEDAILHYRKALILNPIMTEALYNLSWIFATHKNKKFRDDKEAIRLAEELCRITQNNQPLALDALAAAYAETGRYDDAVLTAKKGLKLSLLSGPKELVLGLKKRLRLYQEKRPYRQSMQRKNES